MYFPPPLLAIHGSTSAPGKFCEFGRADFSLAMSAAQVGLPASGLSGTWTGLVTEPPANAGAPAHRDRGGNAGSGKQTPNRRANTQMHVKPFCVPADDSHPQRLLGRVEMSTRD
jgi:hypothetical protein